MTRRASAVQDEIFTVRFERAFLTRVRAVARASQRTTGELIRLAVRAWIEGRAK